MKPRTKVRPGSFAKSSSSSAVTWRGASFNCCATVSSDIPIASRAARSMPPAVDAARGGAEGAVAVGFEICSVIRNFLSQALFASVESG